MEKIENIKSLMKYAISPPSMSPPLIVSDGLLVLSGVFPNTAKVMRRRISGRCDTLVALSNEIPSKLERLQDELENVGQELIGLESAFYDVEDEVTRLVCERSSLEHQKLDLEQQLKAVLDELTSSMPQKMQLEFYVRDIAEYQAIFEKMRAMLPKHDFLLTMWELNGQAIHDIQHIVRQLQVLYEPHQQLMYELHFKAMCEFHKHDLYEIEKAMNELRMNELHMNELRF